MPDFILEDHWLTTWGKTALAGADEVGCGSWAGPVVAAAVIFEDRTRFFDLLPLIQDSKKLSAAKRMKISKTLLSLQGQGIWYAFGEASREEIDTLNIRCAALLAIKRALEGLSVTPKAILVDGTQIPTGPWVGHAIPKGDDLCFSIAAASILAKVRRDQMMTDLAHRFPHYGWEKNAGYGTAFHQQGLHTHGLTPHHRRSFSPVRALLTQTPLILEEA